MDGVLRAALSAAQAAVEAAGEVLVEWFGKVREVGYKGGELDLVTEADRLAEEAAFSVLQERYPDWQVLGEESGGAGLEEGWCWVVDPLDGTTNYAHGYPFFGVSVGLVRDGRPVLGVVYDPLREELFWAGVGGGAWLGGQRIEVSRTPEVRRSLLITGFPYSVRQNPNENLKYFNFMVMHAQGIRRDGAAALDLCYVACGRADGFWEFGLRAWDVAAGSVIVAEAGGRVSGIFQAEFGLESGEILATNGLIHEELRGLLQEAHW